MTAERPDMIHVLFIDDEETREKMAQIRELTDSGVLGRLRHPEEVDDMDLTWADVVVVDYFLEHWQERDGASSPARRPLDGIAAIASMRSSLLPKLHDRGKGSPVRPVAFALLSGHLPEASFNLPTAVIRHVFSRENGIEWAFQRDEIGTAAFGNQLASLGDAVRLLSAGSPWRSEEAAVELDRLLGLTSVESEGADARNWIDRARDEVLSCHPPIHELSARTHGLVMLRWLLHRVLPYPTFLLDENQLCARLRVDNLATPGTTRPNPLEDALREVEYVGALHQFHGRRWWRAGVEDWLYRRTDGNSGSSEAVARVAIDLGARRETAWQRPVVVIDESLAARPRFAEADEVVRVLPDDWPVYADAAYAAIEDVLASDLLASLVAPEDRDIVEDKRASAIDDEPGSL